MALRPPHTELSVPSLFLLAGSLSPLQVYLTPIALHKLVFTPFSLYPNWTTLCPVSSGSDHSPTNWIDSSGFQGDKDHLCLNRDLLWLKCMITNACQVFHTELTGVLWEVLNLEGNTDICQTLHKLPQIKLFVLDYLINRLVRYFCWPRRAVKKNKCAMNWESLKNSALGQKSRQG